MSSTPRQTPEAPDLELPEATLIERSKRVDVTSVAPEHLAWVERYHGLEVVGLENVLVSEPAVYASNFCYLPMKLGSMFFSETWPLTTRLLEAQLHHTIFTLGHHHFWHDPIVAKKREHNYAALGLIPATVGNGSRALKLGLSLFIFPEGRDSIPPYRLRYFRWGFARMAWTARSRVVPIAFTGPHEAYFRVTKGDRLVFLNVRQRHPAPFRLEFLPAMNVREYVTELDDSEAMSAFCTEVRERIQSVIDSVTRGRPRTRQAERLQQQHGDCD